MKERETAGGEYVRSMRLEGWMNRCLTCGMQGYKPELPDQIYRWPSAHVAHLKSYFQPLALDENGLCEQCRAAQESLRDTEEHESKS